MTRANLHAQNQSREASLFDQPRLDVQLQELAALRDGWLDGDGVAPDRVGLEWFEAQFADHYPVSLPTPYLYPTPDGGLQAEWSLAESRMDLTVDLKAHRGEWDETGPGEHWNAFELDLDKHADWVRLVRRVREMMGSDR